MSSLSNSKTVKILDYWNAKLRNNQSRIPFLATKLIEISAFKSVARRQARDRGHSEFPCPKNHTLPLHPKTAIVVPVYIDSFQQINILNNLFDSISAQTIDPDFIIIVDDHSPVPFGVPCSFHYERVTRKSGPAKARNFGKNIALESGADIVAFTDSDCVLAESWVGSILSSFMSDTGYHILSGNTISVDKHWLGKYHNLNGTLNGRLIKGSERLLYGTTANMAVTKEVAQRLDFCERFPFAAGEDIEFCFRANQNGYAIKYSPQMRVRHNYGYSYNAINSIIRFVKLFRKYGEGESYLLKEVPEYYQYLNETEEITIK